MRVVCDNCGAVYKIANEKLTKEVNRATCKRCGHKIIIYKPGSRAAEEAAASRAAPSAVEEDGDEERTVIKSVPELQKMASQQGVPSIGSLTAELRAISIPGIQSPSSASSGPDTLGPGPTSEPDTEPRSGGTGSAPAVIPATAIPASDSPATKVYNGPSPAVSTAAAPTPAPMPALPSAASKDSTRPMGMPSPTAASPTGAAGLRSAAAGGGALPSIASGTPSSSTGVAPVTDGGGAVMGVVGLFATVGLVGLIAAIYVPGPMSALPYGLAALGLSSCMFVVLVTQRGRKSPRTPVGLILGFVVAIVIGVLQFLAAGGLATTPSQPPAPTAVKAPPTAEPAPTVDTASPEAASEEPAAGELSESELEEARRFSSDEVASLGGDRPEPTPAKESKRDVVTRTPPSERRPTPRAKSTEPAASTARKSTPPPRAGPAKATVSAPAEEASAPPAPSDGPSPFVIDTIIRNNAAIVRCLRVEEAKGVDLSGKIYLKFTISPDGSVTKARVTTSRFAGTALDSCISRELDALTFPDFEGSAKKITYPLIVQ